MLILLWMCFLYNYRKRHGGNNIIIMTIMILIRFYVYTHIDNNNTFLCLMIWPRCVKVNTGVSPRQWHMTPIWQCCNWGDFVSEDPAPKHFTITVITPIFIMNQYFCLLNKYPSMKNLFDNLSLFSFNGAYKS